MIAANSSLYIIALSISSFLGLNHHKLSLTVIKKMYIRMRLYKKETLVVGLLYKGESGDLLDSLLQVDNSIILKMPYGI